MGDTFRTKTRARKMFEDRPDRRHISLRTKLLAGFGVVVVLVIALLAASNHFIGETARRMEETLNAHVRPLASLNGLQARINRIRAIEIELPRYLDLFAVTDQLETLRTERRDFGNELTAFANELRKRDPADAESLRENWRRYDADLGIASESAASMQMARVQQISTYDSVARFKAISLTLKRQAENTELLASAAFVQSLADHDRQRRWFYLISAGGLLIIAGWSLLLSHSLHARLARLRDAAARIAAGEAERTIDPEGNDELTELGVAFNTMQERIRARERALHDSRERFRDLAESASDWFWEMDANLRFTYLSDRFFETTGLRREAILGRLRWEVAEISDTTQDAEKWRRHREDLEARRPIRRFEYAIRSANGQIMHFSITGKPTLAEGGVFLGYRGTGTNITELLAAQADLVRAEKLAALGGLVAGIAHEINTPLGIGFTAATHLDERTREFGKLLAAGQLRKSEIDTFVNTAGECATSLVANLRRAGELVRSFKQVAVDQSSDRKREFDFRSYLDEIMVSLNPQLKRTRHVVRINCPDGVVIDSYPGAFAQVIANLVMNSLIHGFEDIVEGHIDIQVAADDEELRLVYRDDGKGMPDADAKRIYEPFFTTKAHQGGSGLGMHVVHNLVTQTLGGEIRCETGVGQGVRFTIKIPANKGNGHESSQ